jgi:hypothetical protein
MSESNYESHLDFVGPPLVAEPGRGAKRRPHSPDTFRSEFVRVAPNLTRPLRSVFPL